MARPNLREAFAEHIFSARRRLKPGLSGAWPDGSMTSSSMSGRILRRGARSLPASQVPRRDDALHSRGLAHGFQTLTVDVVVEYLMGVEYVERLSDGLRHDPMIGIKCQEPITLAKDAAWPLLADRDLR